MNLVPKISRWREGRVDRIKEEKARRALLRTRH